MGPILLDCVHFVRASSALAHDMDSVCLSPMGMQWGAKQSAWNTFQLSAQCERCDACVVACRHPRPLAARMYRLALSSCARTWSRPWPRPRSRRSGSS